MGPRARLSPYKQGLGPGTAACDMPPLCPFPKGQSPSKLCSLWPLVQASLLSQGPGAKRCGSGNGVEVPRLLRMLGRAPTCTQIVPGQGWRELLMHVGVCRWDHPYRNEVSRLPF